jgi:hypothetical protein
MSIFKDIANAAKKIPKTVGSAVTGKKGLLGKKGTLGLLAKGKVAKAAKATGKAVSKVVSNPIIQASFPIATVPASIISGAVAGGPKGALKAAKTFSKNPIFKAELAAAGVLFPPVAPASAAGLAAMEATSRVVDGINSKDPKKIGAAIVQVAGTQLLASQGNADAKRALNLMKDVNAAKKVVLGKVPGAMPKILAGVKAGDKKAKKALDLVQKVAVRNAGQVVKSKTAPPKKKAAAAKMIAKAQIKKPGLATGTLAALNSPKGIRVGDFSVLSTGRILYLGRPVRMSRAA